MNEDEPSEELLDIDALMSIDPLDLSAQDLDAIIQYQRNMRAKRESGVRTRKPKPEGPMVKLDLSKLGLIKTPTNNTVIRRRV